MFKYAFILNSENLTPETYSLVYKNEEFYCKIVAVNSMEMCFDLANKLADDGVELIDLCGDFDAEKAQAIKDATGGRLDVCHAKYTEKELARVEALPALDEYGIIVNAPGVLDKPVKMELKSDECNTYVAFVANEEMANDVANEMAEGDAVFIELCSYFTKEKTEKLAKAIDYKIPVGYCGE